MSESARELADHIDKELADNDGNQKVINSQERPELRISTQHQAENDTALDSDSISLQIDCNTGDLLEKTIESRKTLSLDSNCKSDFLNNFSGSTDNFVFDSGVRDDFNEHVRRNSLPEGNRSDFAIPNSSSVNFKVESLECAKVPSLQSDRAKVAPNMHNISDVVRNVHGLFSIVKNAYKPMERNIGELVMATQKNLSSAKNGYLTRHDSKPHEFVENLNKYATLNLSNENRHLDAEIFSKCGKFGSADSVKDCGENDAQKTNEVSLGGKIDSEKTSECYRSEKSDIKTVDNPESDSVSFDLNRERAVESSTQDVDCRNSRVDAGEADEVTPGAGRHSRSGPEEVLEATVLEQNAELEAMRNSLAGRDAQKKELEAKITNLSRQLEASVMRYAVSERTAIAAEKEKLACAGREGRAREEAGLLDRRLRTAQAERSRICDMLDQKSHEVASAQKEIARHKEELHACEVKLKWTQNKLMSEIEAHKEATSLAERLGHQVAQLENGAGNNSLTNNTLQSSELDAQMKEKEASAILERHERMRLDALCRQLQAEVERARAASGAAASEARELRAQVGSGAAECDALRDACSELRVQAARDCERLAAAQARAARVDTLTAHLQQEQERAARLHGELEAERRARAEALADAALGTRREAELLRQAERLTAAGVRQQAACSEAEAKALALSVDNASLRAAGAGAARERERGLGDARALAAAPARHQRAERAALQRLEQAEGAARAAAAKHASALKELKREAQHWKRKCEKMDSECQSLSAAPKPTERTGSCSSLSSFEGSSTQQNSQTDSLEPVLDVQVDRQQLVERVVQLQRAGARRAERVAFLEGHAAQLTAELQRKARVLRALLAAAPRGALAPPDSDRSKAEIGRHGGIMASVYNHEVSDSGMTLELSMEMNAKLQGLLEDTLLKNITLKENMDTLGDEIASLKEELKKKTKK